jgi:hypothetical protein
LISDTGIGTLTQYRLILTIFRQHQCTFNAILVLFKVSFASHPSLSKFFIIICLIRLSPVVKGYYHDKYFMCYILMKIYCTFHNHDVNVFNATLCECFPRTYFLCYLYINGQSSSISIQISF